MRLLLRVVVPLLLWATVCTAFSKAGSGKDVAQETSSGDASATASVKVVSEPSGVKIHLDGTDTREFTPHTFANVSVGHHVLKLTAWYFEDYEQSFELTQDGATINAEMQLKSLKPVCGVVGDLSRKPEITFTGLKSGDHPVKGRIRNVDTCKVRVLLWAKTDLWYLQEPSATLYADGSWEGPTYEWIRMLALLVDSRYRWSGASDYRPWEAAAGVLAWDEYPARTHGRSVLFSGYRWWVLDSDLEVGPGPNYFSDYVGNVWVDKDALHLKIRTVLDDKWRCAGVAVFDHSLGYGEYTFQLDGSVAKLGADTVAAGFTYESDEREIDIEFSKALAAPMNAQYVVQPADATGNRSMFTMPAVRKSTHRFIWRPDHIEFTSWRGFDPEPRPKTTIHSWVYRGPDVPLPGNERMYFNLWLYEGKPPASGKGDAIVIRSFTFKP